MFKDFLMRKMLKSQGVPEKQIDDLLVVINKNPDLFKKIGTEVEAKTKAGMSQAQASMLVMKSHQAELQKLFNQK